MADKSFETTPPAAGSPHLPNVDPTRCVVLPEGMDARDFITDLLAGRAVVAAAFADMVERTADVRVDEDKVIHPGRSAHGVGFGTFSGSWIIPQRFRRAESVAFKPFKRPEDALNEVRGYLTLKEQGIETFTPIGAFPAQHGQHVVVVTSKRNDLRSLDRDQWVSKRDVTDAASIEIGERNNQTLVSIAELLAYIHARGIYHPDGQIKNFAKTPTGKVGIIDTENLEQTMLDNPSSAQYAWRDFQKLIKSLIYPEPVTDDENDGNIFGVGMWSGLSVDVVKSNIEKYLIEPYLEKLTEEYEGASPEKEAQIDQLGGIVYYFNGDKEWLEKVVERAKEKVKAKGQVKIAA